jgi:hypothetical protein
MKGIITKIGHINCKEATFLLTKKEEGQSSKVENAKLAFHLLICVTCKRFARQTAFIIKNARYASEYVQIKMSLQRKQQIKDLLR